MTDRDSDPDLNPQNNVPAISQKEAFRPGVLAYKHCSDLSNTICTGDACPRPQLCKLRASDVEFSMLQILHTSAGGKRLSTELDLDRASTELLILACLLSPLSC